MVSIFEWSTETDEDARADPNNRQKKFLSTKEPNNYFSLPTVLTDLKPLPECSLNGKRITPSDKRRNELEKYNRTKDGEENHRTLNSKGHCNVAENAEKIETTSNRSDQRDLKDESICSKSCSFADRNFNRNEGAITNNNDSSITKENSAKALTAITTISILYTSRKRKDSADGDKIALEKPNSDTKEATEKSDTLSRLPKVAAVRCAENVEEKKFLADNNRNFTKPVDRQPEDTKRSSKPSSNFDEKVLFTASLERKTCKLKNFVKEESLVAKRVSQLSKASELFQSSNHRRNGDPGYVTNICT